MAPCSRAHTTYTCTRYSIAQRKTIESRRKIPAPTRMQFNDCVRARGRPGDERTNHAGDRNNAFLSTCSRGPRIYTFSAPSSSRGSKSRSPPLFIVAEAVFDDWPPVNACQSPPRVCRRYTHEVWAPTEKNTSQIFSS